jgi:hypothetical protein
MRLVRNIPHELYQITIFEWNNKFIIKIESGPYEQSYKLDMMDITEPELDGLLTEEFLQGVSKRFHTMHQDMARSQGMI